MVRCEETNDQLKHLLGPETFPTSTPLPSRRTSAPEHHTATSTPTAVDNHHCGWVGAAEENCYCETDRLALSHIPSANWTYNDEEDEEKLSCSHTTEGSDENKRYAVRIYRNLFLYTTYIWTSSRRNGQTAHYLMIVKI